MSPPGFFRACRLIAAKDLRLEWRTGETLAASLIFSLAVLVLFNFAFGLATVQQVGVARLVPGVIWTVLAFATVVSLVRSAEIERRRDTLAALFLTPVDRGALYAGKALANALKLALLQLVVVPLTALFFDYNLLGVFGPLVLVLGVHSLGLAILGTLFAAVATRVGRGEALLGTLLFPAVSPLLISAMKCTTAALEGSGLASVSRWMLVAVGFDLLYLFVSLLTFEYVLEE